MPQRIGKQIHELLMNCERVLLVPHKNPDGDACGAVSALGLYLQNLQKKADIFCATAVPKELQILPLMDIVTSNPATWETPYDAIIVCDSGNPEYAGVNSYLQKNSTAKVVVVDHHPTNTYFGDLNLVSLTNSSTCEILYEYFTYNRINITPDMATALLCGIIYDTGSFSNSATSKKSLSIAGSLVKKGGSMKDVVRSLYKNKHMNTLKLWGKALSGLAYDTELDIVSMTISIEDMLSCGVDEEGADGIANFMNALKDGKVHMVFREKPNNLVKVSMRTTKDDVDVSQIAKAFGGGGHKKAAGFTIESPIKSVYEKILPTLNKCLKQV
ncbi:MAG TPA: bifunctional oligoribonuclease/PAP phosphatase NrnA [Candidatus Magasanikbacteria bacterium]|nr:bifunctional oligoribonuclease/PAP phosphatase NrnA [Candidatus Magasanikbacteria bacterium]